MDKLYIHKLLKLAIATPLAYGLALVLDLDSSLSFLGPLMVFSILFCLPDSVGFKRFILLKLITSLLPTIFAAAFMAGLWEINSMVIFILILLAGWGLQVWMPSVVSFGILPTELFLTTNVLNSSAPYTTAVYMSLLLVISLGLVWLVERLFWPIFDEQSIKEQVSKTFQLFQYLSDRAFQPADLTNQGDSESFAELTVRAKKSIRATNQAFKKVAMASTMTRSDQDAWMRAIALQTRLLAHLLAISGLLQENWDNPELQKLAPKLLALGDSLSRSFAGFSRIIISPQSGIQVSSPNLDFQKWQTQLNNMRTTDITQSHNLANRLAVGLIENRLAGLSSDLSKMLSWIETHYSAVPNNLLILP